MDPDRIVADECPVCGGQAERNDDQEGTIYCQDSHCGYMGSGPLFL